MKIEAWRAGDGIATWGEQRAFLGTRASHQEADVARNLRPLSCPIRQSRMSSTAYEEDGGTLIKFRPYSVGLMRTNTERRVLRLGSYPRARAGKR